MHLNRLWAYRLASAFRRTPATVRVLFIYILIGNA